MDQQLGEIVTKLYQKLVGWIERSVLLLPNLFIAALIFTTFYFVGKQAQRFLNRSLGKLSHSPTLVDLVTNLVFVASIVFGLFVALGVLQLDKAVTSLLAGAGIIGLALGFAFQDIAANFVSGILIALRKPIHVDDLIECNGHFGTVYRIHLQYTIIRTQQGQHVYLPNKDINNNPIVNYSLEDKRRVDLQCGVSYGDDLKQVRQVALEAIRSLPGVEKDPEVSFFFQAFSDSSINFVIRYWVKFARQPDYLQGMSEGVIHLKEAFDRHGISIPYPIRTLDFGIKGGEKLVEQLGHRRQQNGNATQGAR